MAPDLTLEAQLAKQDLASRAGGDLAGVLVAIATACKAIAAKVKRARLNDVVGAAGDTNTHGEEQQKLDVLADDLMLEHVAERTDVAVFASEEREEPVLLRESASTGFCVVTDPLDGSSNIDVAVSVGTIFSVLADPEQGDPVKAVLQAGRKQKAAGYVLYGSSVVLVLSVGAGVDMYVLDPTSDAFLLVQEGLRIPERQKIYSINEAYWNDFSDPIRDYLNFAHGDGYGSRYIGSMVADVHRTLLKGGVFIYPATTKAPKGKLRLLYEGNPMAMLMEQAGGAAETEAGRLLDVQPSEVHQRTSVILGSSAEVAEVTRRF